MGIKWPPNEEVIMQLTAARIREIINLTDKWHTQYDLKHADRDSDKMPSFEALMAYGNDPVKLELMRSISDLSEREQEELLALFWLGRDAIESYAEDDDAEGHI
jgi:hypothetical protein